MVGVGAQAGVLWSRVQSADLAALKSFPEVNVGRLKGLVRVESLPCLRHCRRLGAWRTWPEEQPKKEKTRVSEPVAQFPLQPSSLSSQRQFPMIAQDSDPVNSFGLDLRFPSPSTQSLRLVSLQEVMGLKTKVVRGEEEGQVDGLD